MFGWLNVYLSYNAKNGKLQECDKVNRCDYLFKFSKIAYDVNKHAHALRGGMCEEGTCLSSGETETTGQDFKCHLWI